MPSTIVQKVLKDLEFFPYVIVVPPTAGDQLGEGGTAILPLRSLDQWLDREMAKRLGSHAVPTVSSVQIEMDITSDPVVGRATMNVRVDGSGANWVSIALGEVSLKQVRMREWVAAPTEVGGVKRSDEWIPTARRSASGYEILFDRAGSYELEVEFLADVSRLPSDRTIKLTPPAASVTQARVTSSTELAFVRNLTSGRDVSLGADQKSADVPVVSGEGLSLAWRKVSDVSPRSASVSVRTQVEVHIEPKSTLIESIMEVESAADLVEMTLRIPIDDQNVQVLPTQKDQPLAHDIEWSEVEGARQCLIRLARPVNGSFRLRVMSQRATVIGPAGMEIGVPEWQGTRSTPSLMMLWWSPNLWVRVRPGPTARRVDVSELGGEFNDSPPRQAFRLLESGASIVATSEMARPVLTATAKSDLVVGRDAQLTTRFVMSVRGAQADSFMFVIPRTMKGLEVVPGDLLRLEEMEIDQESPTREVRAILAEVIEDEELEVTLRGEIPLDSQGTNQIPLPSLDADRFVQGSLSVRVEPGMRLVLDDAGTEYLRREPIPEDDPIEPPTYWYFRRQPGEARLAFHIESLPATIDSGVETLVARTEKEIEVRTQIRFHARFAPFDEVSVFVPSSLKSVQVTSDLLVENVRLEPGSVVPLRLRNPTSSCEIQLDYRLPLPTNAGTLLPVPLILPRGTTLEAWTGRIYSDRGLRATVGTGWIGSMPAPSRVVESGRRAVADVRPADMSTIGEELSIQFEPTALLATLVVPRVAIEEVVTPEGHRWARKRWLISKHRTRDISIRLPEGSRRLMTFVDGQPVEDTPAGDGLIQVRLPAVDSPTTVELDYDFPNPRRRGAIALEGIESPVIIDDSAIEQVRWTFRVMEDRLLFRWGSTGPSAVMAFLGLSQVESSGATAEFDDIKWLDQAGYDVNWSQRVRDVVSARVWHFSLFNRDGSIGLITVREPFWVLACSGICLVLILALSRLSLANQLRVGLGAFVLMMGLLAVIPELLSWLWIGARWGLGLGLLAVLVHWLIVIRRNRSPLVGGRRIGRGSGVSPLGSSILKQLEPKTRISTRVQRREE
jgi:hypothetical protein